MIRLILAILLAASVQAEVPAMAKFIYERGPTSYMSGAEGMEPYYRTDFRGTSWEMWVDYRKVFLDSYLSALKEEPGCGIEKIWWWQGAFTPCCEVHDAEYDMLQPGQSTRFIDREFFECCLFQSKDSLILKAHAYGFYPIIRAWGFYRQGVW